MNEMKGNVEKRRKREKEEIKRTNKGVNRACDYMEPVFWCRQNLLFFWHTELG